MWRIIKRVFLITMAAIALLLATGVILVDRYQNEILEAFVQKANTYINTPVQPQTIEVSLWNKFPDISISLKNVLMEGALPGEGDTLATAGNIHFTFSFWDLLQGKQTIDAIYLEDASVYLMRDEQGNTSYNIISKNEDQQRGGEVNFNIRKIALNRVRLVYTQPGQQHVFFLKEMNSSLRVENDIYFIDVEGDGEVNNIQVGKNHFFSQTPVELDVILQYDDDVKRMAFDPSEVRTAAARFDLAGSINLMDQTYLNLQIEGNETTISQLLSLSPPAFREKVAAYQSDGNAYFQAEVKGEVSQGKNPGITVSFGCNDTRLYHPKFEKEFTDMSFKGSFTNGKERSNRTSKLSITNFHGKLDGRPLIGELVISDFDRLHTRCQLDADVDVQALLNFYPIENIKEAGGIVDMQVSFEGSIRDFKRSVHLNRFRTSGEVNLRGLSLQLNEFSVPLKAANGNFIFNNNDLAISDFQGQLGRSDFRLNGFFKNIIYYFALEKQYLSIEADLQSKFIDMDELLQDIGEEGAAADAGSGESKGLSIPGNVNLVFQCNIDAFKLERFNGRNIRGELQVRESIARGRNLTMDAAGGRLKLDGRIDNTDPDLHKIAITSNLNNIYIDSVFYIFKNFKQDFLVEENLRGQVDAQVTSVIYLTSGLDFMRNHFTSDIRVTIRNGELNNFEPMMRLSKYIKSGDLEKLRFSNLENRILISDKTIQIPSMNVSTNVTSIDIEGTHTFDQEIDYRLRIPMRSFMKPDRDAEFGPVAAVDKGNSNIFLRITGTTEDYKMSYDTERVAEKIKTDIKKEGQELREAFKNKGLEEEKDVELSEDDYFDF